MSIYYISTTGNDSTGNGLTPATAWATISKAFTSSANGDTIVCAAGTYTWAGQNFTTGRTITGASLANGLPTTIFDGAGGAIAWRWSGSMAFNNIRWQNAVMTSGTPTPFFTNNSVTNTTAVFTNCHFKTISFYQGLITGGFNATGNTYSLVNCLIQSVRNVTGTGNYQAMFIDSAGSGTFLVTGCDIYIDTWTNDGSCGLVLSNQSTWTLTIKNTTIRNNSGTTVKWNPGVGSFTQAVTYSCLNGLTSAPTGGTGVITTDPLYVDAANSNFRKRPTSPARNTGTTT